MLCYKILDVTCVVRRIPSVKRKMFDLTATTSFPTNPSLAITTCLKIYYLFHYHYIFLLVDLGSAKCLRHWLTPINTLLTTRP